MPFSTAHSHPLNLWLCLALPLLLMALLLVLPTTGIDFAITQYFYTPGVGFAGKHSYLLENILHERAKQVVILLGLLALAGLITSFFYRPWHWLRLPTGLSGTVHQPVSQRRHAAQSGDRRALPLGPRRVRRQRNLHPIVECSRAHRTPRQMLARRARQQRLHLLRPVFCPA